VNPRDNFAHQLAMACFIISYRSRVTHGYIATNSPEDTTLTDIFAHTRHLVQDVINNYFMLDVAGNVIYDADGNPFDIGKYITVLAGPDITFKHATLGIYTTNSAPILGGMISAMPVSSSPLNKQVPAIRGIRYTFGNPQLNALCGARFVTYRPEDNGASIVCTDWATCAQPGSDYANGVNWRSVKKVVDQIRDVCNPYIGEPPTIANQNAMSTAIDKRIELLIKNGDATRVAFQIECGTLDRVLGRARIKLTIVPPNTLREITTVVEVAPA
jgi:hypothetical protein